jgi:hypothetical protein
MPDAMLVLGATAAAAVVAALVMLVGTWPARTSRNGLAILAEVLAIGGGMGIGCWWLGLVPRWPPLEDQDRLLLVLLPAAGIVEILAALLRRRPWFGRAFRLLLALPTPALLLLGSGYLPGGEAGAPSTWTGREALAILLSLGALLAAVWGLSIRAAQRPGGFVVPAALGLISAAAGVCLILSGYATGGLIGLPFAGVAAGALVVCLLLARGHAMTGVVGVGSVFLFGLLMSGRFFAELTTTNFALLIASPLFCWLVALPPVREFKAPLRFLTALVVCLIPAGVAVGLAVRSYSAETSEASAYGDAAAASDAPAFGAAPSSGVQKSGTAGASSAPSADVSNSPRDPASDEPSPAGDSGTKRPPAPVDPGEDLKK